MDTNIDPNLAVPTEAQSTAVQNHHQTITALRRGRLELQGQFINSSNYTFLVDVTYRSQHLVSVYKPTRGERPLWDFPRGTLAKREVAAYEVSQALGWELVPVTIYRHKAPLGPGSLQQYIGHDPDYHYFNFSEQDKQRLHSTVVFDYLVNNADRKGSHILRDDQNHLWLIDHGICFHEEYKLRTVLWDFSGEEVPETLLLDIRHFLEEIESRAVLYKRLHTLIYTNEIAALARRVRHILETRKFPNPSQSHRSYPWPPV